MLKFEPFLLWLHLLMIENHVYKGDGLTVVRKGLQSEALSEFFSLLKYLSLFNQNIISK